MNLLNAIPLTIGTQRISLPLHIFHKSAQSAKAFHLAKAKFLRLVIPAKTQSFYN